MANRLKVCKLVFALLLINLTTKVDMFAQTPECKDVMRGEEHPGEWYSKGHQARREFLWKHWSAKTYGELFVVGWSREGVRSDIHFHLEPVRDGSMVLTVDIAMLEDPEAVSGMAVTASGQVLKPSVENTDYKAFSIDRIGRLRAPFVMETAPALSDSKSLPPSKYRLRFRDKDGTVITDY